MRAASFLACVALAIAFACAIGACTVKEPQPTTYFDRTIAPVLQSGCVRTNTGAGCHVADPKGNAFGNLDLTTYAGVQRRRDLLLDYGPYLQPSMLVKNVAPYRVAVQLWDGTKVNVTTDVKHTGGAILDSSASGFITLRRWIENGATENNTGVPPVTITATPCSHAVPSGRGFDPTSDPAAADYALFAQAANPILQKACAAGNCHGTAVNALYLTCGVTAEELRWNYFAASEFLATPPEQSELIRRPLASSQGGSYHEGGPLFASVTDPSYTALVTWALKHGAPQPANLDPAFIFFAQKVQPVLVKKGCMMAQCHSAAMFHDYRLRGGSAGSFSLGATRRNYDFSIAQMSFESDDVEASRLVRKNLYRPELASGSTGLLHRGGPLLEDFGASKSALVALARGTLCDQAQYDYAAGDVDAIPAYCILREWHKRERAERSLAPLSAIVYVKRPPPAGADRPQDFDVFAGGASLHVIKATQATGGGIQVGVDVALDLTPCGLVAAADVRRPAVSWDGKTIAFAARSTDTEPLAIYTMNADGTACVKQPVIAARDAQVAANGLLVHDFDPAFSPPGDDGVERLVFASTRGNLDPSSFDYVGPQRTPSDPTKANANLYVVEPDPQSPAATRIRQLTFQLNMERMPNFMQDGRLVFTAEKREPGLYQLALRRQNLDGGDYHPLFAQRASIGASQATNVVELSDKNFATIFSEPDAQHGAGSLAVFNRSIGVDFSSSSPTDYPVDPEVVNAAAPSAPEASFFLHSLRIIGQDGSYTSPSALPGGNVLVSFGAGAPSTFVGDYDVYVVNPVTGDKTKLFGEVGAAELEAVPVYARAAKGIFASALDEPNGHTSIDSGDRTAEVTVLDLPVLGSLLFQNTPTGRVLETDLRTFDVYEELPPTPDVTTFAVANSGFVTRDAYGSVYVRRRLLGTVPIQADGSARFRIQGGVPIVLHLPDSAESRKRKLPRWQREEMTFLPGEHAHQAMPRGFFDNLCAGCHGSISGRPLDVALKPDFLTQASAVAASTMPATDCTEGGPARAGSVIGPPASP